MYGLPQAGILANQQLQKTLAKHGFYPSRHTPGYWKHTNKPISFCLVVYDFLVKYTNKNDANQLLKILQDNCDLSMPAYVPAAINKFQHPHPTKP
mmetsp:Transcript_20670/g.31558  ORF Transcript_20670/g.31558 Transcript_20670/m.31558 type:complete len:95 (-) Transcript_20670:750-1034(-)